MASTLGLWGPVAALMAAIFYVQSWNDVSGPVDAWFSDTVLHMGCYGLLALLALRALARGRWAGVTVAAAIGAWAISTGYGATDEWHQMYVTGRNAELRDLVNDAIGALAAVVAAGAWGIMRGPSRAE